MQQPDGWTDERVKTTVDMWKEGASASEIALAIGGGLSRSAVCGKLDRLGLKSGSRAPKIAAEKKPRAGGFVGKLAAVKATKNKGGSSKTQMAEMRPAKIKPLLFGNPGGASAKPPMAVDGPVFTAAERVPVALLDLGRDCCKWPLGDPLKPGFGFCGAPVIAEGKPYCAAHRARAYTTPSTPLRPPSPAPGNRAPARFGAGRAFAE